MIELRVLKKKQRLIPQKQLSEACAFQELELPRCLDASYDQRDCNSYRDESVRECFIKRPFPEELNTDSNIRKTSVEEPTENVHFE